MIKVEKRAMEISNALKEWVELINKVETTPEEIMPYLYEKGRYNKGKANNALKLRNDLRKLFDNNKLDLIEEVSFVQKDKNKNWYFTKVSI